MIVSLRGLMIATLVATAGCSSSPPDNPKEYVAKITAARAAKDAQFAATGDPIPTGTHPRFLPLAY